MEAETEKDGETEAEKRRPREADRGRQTESRRAPWLAACGLSGSTEFYRQIEYLGLEGAADLVRT